MNCNKRILAHLWRCLALTILALGPSYNARAQCTLVSPPTGTVPWSTCTTWTGPTWQAYATPDPVLLGIDLNGDGLSDLVFFDPSGVHVASSTGSSFSIVSQSLAGGANCYSGNFDGTGRTSIACLAAGQITLATSTGTGFNAFTTSGAANNLYNSQVQGPILGPCKNGSCPVLVESPLANPCLVMDVNGDGMDDIVCGYSVVAMANNNNTPVLSTTWGVYVAGGGGFSYQKWSGSSGGYTFTPNCIIGDFNGDGLKDLACNYSGGTTWNMLFSTGVGWTGQTWANGPSATYGYIPADSGNCLGQLAAQPSRVSCPNPCIVGDFDGDGIDDITCPESSTTWAIGFGGGISEFKNNKSVVWAGITPTNGNSKTQGNCIATDMYGTGLSGLLCLTDNNVTWVYLASTGAAFSPTEFTTPWQVTALNPSLSKYGVQGTVASNCVIADFNGDGIKDIACHGQTLTSNFSASTNWYVGFSSRPN